MNYWTGRIKVVSENLMCFAVDPTTLEAVTCSTYDPYAWKDPEVGPIETISHAEWLRRTQPRHPTHSQYWRL